MVDRRRRGVFMRSADASGPAKLCASPPLIPRRAPNIAAVSGRTDEARRDRAAGCSSSAKHTIAQIFLRSWRAGRAVRDIDSMPSRSYDEALRQARHRPNQSVHLDRAQSRTSAAMRS
jgi:hypothetical protein